MTVVFIFAEGLDDDFDKDFDKLVNGSVSGSVQMTRVQCHISIVAATLMVIA